MSSQKNDGGEVVGGGVGSIARSMTPAAGGWRASCATGRQTTSPPTPVGAKASIREPVGGLGGCRLRAVRAGLILSVVPSGGE